MQATAIRPEREQALAIGGLVAPLAFMGGWVGCGFAVDHYSAVHDVISQLSQVGAVTQFAMTEALVVDGLAVLLFALSLRSALGGCAWITVGITGLATLAVAAFPLGFSDSAHDVFAGLGYVTLAVSPFLAAVTLRAGGFRRAAWMSIVLGLASAVCLTLSMTVGPMGFYQRAGLTLGDLWVVTGAVLILAGYRVRTTRTTPTTRTTRTTQVFG